MLAECHVGNRTRLYEKLTAGSLVAVFSGENTWKTGDEDYMFFADRNFVYLTGLKTSRQAVLLATKEADGSVCMNKCIFFLLMHMQSVGLVRELSRRKQKKFQGLVIYVLWMHLNVISRHWLSAAVTRNCILRCRCSV